MFLTGVLCRDAIVGNAGLAPATSRFSVMLTGEYNNLHGAPSVMTEYYRSRSSKGFRQCGDTRAHLVRFGGDKKWAHSWGGTPLLRQAKLAHPQFFVG
jgi:hypothetical protein